MKAIVFILLIIMASGVSAQTYTGRGSKPLVFSRSINMYEVGDKSVADSILLARIVQRIQAGSIHAYADSNFTAALSVADVDSITKQTEFADSFNFPYAEHGEAVIVIINREGSFFATRDFRIVVQLKPMLKFIAFGVDRDNHLPVDKRELGQPAPYSPKKTFFWMPYNEVSALLSERDASVTGKKFSEWVGKIVAKSDAGNQ